MRISIITIGSRGDVHPYIALGHGLQRAGHSVCLITHAVFKDVVCRFGLDFFALDESEHELFQTEAGQRMLQADGLLLLHQFARATRPMISSYLEQCWHASQGADVIISSLQGFFYGRSIAEKLQVPYVSALLQPTQLPTRAFADPMVPSSLVRLYHQYGPVNFLTHVMTQHILWTIFLPYIDIARKKILNLPPFPLFSPFMPLQRWSSLLLLGYSPLVIPRPQEWEQTVCVTGYWFLDPPSVWTPPAGLQHFLKSGPSPIYIGFGSMSSDDPEKLTELVCEALARNQQRGVLLTGWGAFHQDRLPKHICAVSSVPHDWLFSQVKAVIHHGGAGTTGASLRAGLPTGVVSFLPEQSFWGERVWQLGAGPRPLLRRQLTVDSLARMINQLVSTDKLRRRAEQLGQKLRMEQGVTNAVHLFERFIAAPVEKRSSYE